MNKYVVWVLVAAVVIGGGYWLYQEAKKNAGAPKPVPSVQGAAPLVDPPGSGSVVE